MCGRFTLTKDARIIVEHYNLKSLFGYQPRFNIAPTQPILGVISSKGNNVPVMLKWGLIPSWSKDKAIGAKMINAKAETVDVKPSFAKLLRRSRCLIPADGFYEWKSNGKKISLRIIKKGQDLFSFAGLWDEWLSPEGISIKSCTIGSHKTSNTNSNLYKIVKCFNNIL